LKPVTCLQYGALEMIESPDVAIVQHASGVMQVVHNLFENASMLTLQGYCTPYIVQHSDNLLVTYLTNLIYTSIQYAVGSGDLACVGTSRTACFKDTDFFSSLAITRSFVGKPSRAFHLKKMESVSRAISHVIQGVC
jgi:hypothetical protein